MHLVNKPPLIAVQPLIAEKAGTVLKKGTGEQGVGQCKNRHLQRVQKELSTNVRVLLLVALPC